MALFSDLSFFSDLCVWHSPYFLLGFVKCKCFFFFDNMKPLWFILVTFLHCLLFTYMWFFPYLLLSCLSLNYPENFEVLISIPCSIFLVLSCHVIQHSLFVWIQFHMSKLVCCSLSSLSFLTILFLCATRFLDLSLTLSGEIVSPTIGVCRYLGIAHGPTDTVVYAAVSRHSGDQMLAKVIEMVFNILRSGDFKVG
jgi:hypothetical protein